MMKYATHYYALAALLLGSVVAYLIASPIVVLQMLIGIIAVGGYVTWGILHHMIVGDITVEVAMEYVIMGILLLVIIWSYLFRY